MGEGVGVRAEEGVDGTPPQSLSHGALGKGTLGTWRPDWEAASGHRSGSSSLSRGGEPVGEPVLGEVHACQRLNLPGAGKSCGGKAKLRTGPGRSGRPAWYGGLGRRSL